MAGDREKDDALLDHLAEDRLEAALAALEADSEALAAYRAESDELSGAFHAPMPEW